MKKWGLSKLGLYIPGAPRRETPFRCRMCNVQLTNEEYEGHIVACAKRHQQQIHDQSPAVRLPDIFDPETDSLDVELEKWVRKHGRTNPS